MNNWYKILTAKKDDYMLSQGIPKEIVDYAMDLSEEYAIWIAREIWQPIKNADKSQKSYDYLYQKRQGLRGDVTKEEVKGLDQEISKALGKLNVSKAHEEHLRTGQMFVFNQAFRHILDWANAENPDIMKYNLNQAQEASEQWHEELKNQEVTEDYKTHNVIYQFDDGWQIVELSPEDCEAEGERMGHCVGGYSDYVRRGTSKIFSLRDPKNEPHATIETKNWMRQELNSDAKIIDFEQIQGKENSPPKDEYAERIKEWISSLKESGNEINGSSYEDSYEMDVADLDEYGTDEFPIYDRYGLLVEYDMGGSPQSYKIDLERIYDRGNGQYGGSVETELIDGLVEYARYNNELNDLKEAVGTIQEKADDDWFENEMNIENYMENQRPDELDQSDFMVQPESIENQTEFGFNDPVRPYLDQERYDQALQEYNEKMELYDEEIGYHRDEFYPLQFVNYAWEALGRYVDSAGLKSKSAKSTNWYKISAKKTDGEEDHDDPKNEGIENESSIGGGTCTSPSSIYGDYSVIQGRNFIPSRLKKKKKKKRKASGNGWYKKADVLEEVDITDIEAGYENEVWDFNMQQGDGVYTLKANSAYYLDGTYGSGYWDVMFKDKVLGRVYSPQDGASLVEDHISGYLQDEDIQEPSEFEHVENQLGLTSDPSTAGYITPEGKLLNLNRGVQGEVDHRTVGGGTAGMQRFIDNGNIRVDYNAGAVHISKPLTSEQKRAIIPFIENGQETFLDVNDGLGELDRSGSFYGESDKRFSQQYPVGTKASKVIKDIEDFFKGNEPAQISDLQRLRGLASNRGWYKRSHTSITDVVSPIIKDHGDSYDIPNFSGHNGDPDIKDMEIIEINGGLYISNKRSMIPFSINNLVKTYKIEPELAVSIYSSHTS